MDRIRKTRAWLRAVATGVGGWAVLLGLLAVWHALLAAPVRALLERGLGWPSAAALTATEIAGGLLAGGTLLTLALVALRRRTRDRHEAREELRRSQARHRMAVEAAHSVIYEWDPGESVISISPRFSRKFGVPSSVTEVDRDWWLSIVHPDDLTGYRADFRAFMAGHADELSHEYRIRPPEGGEVWIHDRAIAQRDAGGRAVRVFGSVEDITGRKTDQLATEQTRERLQYFSRLGADLLWETDETLTFSYVSGEVPEYFGLPGLPVVGMTYHDAVRRLGLEQDPGRIAYHQATLGRREPFRDVEFRYTDTDGRPRSLSTSGEPRFDADGRYLGYRGIAKDVTARYEAERATQERDARIASIVRSSPFPILFKDLDGRYTDANEQACRVLGVTADRLLGRVDAEVHPADSGAEHRALERTVRESGEPCTGETRLLTADGFRELLTTKFPMKDPTGAITGIGVFWTDITELKHKDNALRESEARFRDFARSTSDWFWVTDADLRFVEIGDRIAEVLGREPDLMIGKTREEIAGPEQVARDPETWRRLAEITARREVFRDFEYEITDARGATRVMSVSGIPVFGHDGTFQGYRGGTRDVTQRREAEDAMRKSEELLRLITDNLPAFISYADRDYRYRFVNAYYETQFGIPREEMLGESVWAFSPAGLKEKVLPTMQRAMDGEPTSLEGEFAWIGGGTRWFRANFVPHEEDGEVQGVFILRQDITELKKAERDAVRQAERLKKIANGVPALISYIDRDGRYAFANRVAETWYGRPVSGIVGSTIEEVMGTEAFARFKPGCDRVFAGEPVTFEDRVTYPDGASRHVRIHWEPDFEDGEVTGFYGFVVDTTKQAELEESLRHVQKMEAVGRLTGGIAHDFNNILLAIQANLELVEDAAGHVDGVEPYIGGARRGVDRAAELTRRLLAFSRRQQLHPKVLDLHAILPDFASLLTRTLGGNIEVRMGSVDPALRIKVDPGQFENAILNLAINARDAMTEGGTLSIEVDTVEVSATRARRATDRVPGEYVRISISDDGAGMSEEVRRQAFEPFFTTKEIGHGTGLGLSMVHGFIEQSGGFAEIESRPGEGTRVSLNLPRVAAVTTGEATAPRVRPGTRQGTILLVEDDELVRDATRAILERLGYDVVEAPNGDEATRLLGVRSDINLLLSDVVMPGSVNGFALARQARERHPRLPIVMTSGYSEEALRKSGKAANDFTLLTKPYNQGRLADAVEKAMRRAPSTPPADRAPATAETG